jgi:hypothetical protein
MLLRFYVLEVELFIVWYEKGDASETVGLLEPFITEGEAERGLQKISRIRPIRLIGKKGYYSFNLSTPGTNLPTREA